MPKPLLVDRWALARAFNVNPSTIIPWLREGLSAARVRRGAPQTPALFDGAKAVHWFNTAKAAGQRAWARPVSLDDIRAAAATTSPVLPSSTIATASALMQSFDAELLRLTRKKERNL